MGLPRALKAHKEENANEAILQYQRAYDQGERDAILFQNYGSLLREANRVKEATNLYTEGLTLYPLNINLLGNYANLLNDISPIDSLGIVFRMIRVSKRIENKAFDKTGMYQSAIALLRNIGAKGWAYHMALEAIKIVGVKPVFLGQMIAILDDEEEVPWEIINIVENTISEFDTVDAAEIHFSLAMHYAKKKEHEKSDTYHKLGNTLLRRITPKNKSDLVRQQSVLDVSNWNYGCTCLKMQKFKKGWALYDYGLRTPAKGRQRWQRALRKPFSYEQLNVWKGEDLKGKSILVLEEQAIGDVMMFMVMIPKIIEEAKRVTVLLSDRLVPIFKRKYIDSIEILTHADLKSLKTPEKTFDYQIPIGSIPQYRFTNIEDYRLMWGKSKLKTREENVKLLRDKYLKEAKNSILIGISWQGGAVGPRVKQKSIQPKQFKSMLKKINNASFVNLQYGKTDKIIKNWKDSGIDIIDDNSINPLKDMDLWLHQVDACDAVISVANTTIHGSGGLQKPTLCLLGTNSDWRWLEDVKVKRSYWYPTVNVAHNNEKSGWDDALLRSVEWVNNGCAPPDGPVAL